MPISSKLSFPFLFSCYDFLLRISHLSHACYMCCSSHPLLLIYLIDGMSVFLVSSGLFIISSNCTQNWFILRLFKASASNSYRMERDCEKRISNIMYGSVRNTFEAFSPVISVWSEENHSHYNQHNRSPNRDSNSVPLESGMLSITP